MYEDRDEAALLELYRSEDYTIEARSVAKRLLVARGFTEEQIVGTRDDRVLRTPSSWKDNRAAEHILQAARYRKWIYLITSRLTLICIAVTLFIPLDEHATAVMFCIALHVLVHTAWLRPARILVLRPFNATDQRYGLMKLMRQLCFLGHIYTLEDTVFRGNSGCLPGGGSWAWGWPRLLLTFRLSITTEHGVWKLQRAIGHRFRRNLNWILARHKVFAVNVSNEWWQRCVQVLVNACDAIVIDVSTSRAGVMWELSEIAHYELSERCVFISNSRDLAAVQELARTTDPSGECPTLLYERVSGGTDNKALSFAVAKCIAATRSSSHARFDQVLEREIR